jgi:hypothetical protein
MSAAFRCVSAGVRDEPRDTDVVRDRQCAVGLADELGDAVTPGLGIEVSTKISGRQIELPWQEPDVDHVGVFAGDAELAMLAARSRREHVVVARAEPIDHAAADGVDVGELALQDEAADQEVVVRVHVVAAASAVKDFVAEHPHRSEPRPAALVFVKIEARLPRDESVRVPGDVGRPRAVGADEIMAALSGTRDEGARCWRTWHGEVPGFFQIPVTEQAQARWASSAPPAA